MKDLKKNHGINLKIFNGNTAQRRKQEKTQTQAAAVYPAHSPRCSNYNGNSS